jgi:eukaryotic-like serine/threonine-protein kinase
MAPANGANDTATVIGPTGETYLVGERIGSGGMGTVHRGLRTSDSRTVALKVVRDASPELLARLEREARIVATIEHPNLARVYEVARDGDGAPVVVMELLLGETLGARLRREPALSVPEVARVGLGVLGAVGAAHARSIVHRDLKPDNVFLTSEDGLPSVKVLDFGIAKSERGTALAEGLPTLETRTGHILGTPQYMSPEQIFGEKDVDHRADIWALGVLLYEALAGVRPFDGDNVGQVFKAIALDPPMALAARRPSLPPPLTALITRMLAHARDERPGDLEQIRMVLAPLAVVTTARPLDLATAPTVELERPPLALGLVGGPMKRGRWPLGAALALVLVVAAGGAWRATPHDPALASATASNAVNAASEMAAPAIPAPPVDVPATPPRGGDAESLAAVPLGTPVTVRRRTSPPARVAAGERDSSPSESAGRSSPAGAPAPSPPPSGRSPRSGALRRDEF